MNVDAPPNPLAQSLNASGKRLVLASGSPRRKAFLEALGLPFEIRPRPVDEIHPDHLEGAAIAEYLAKLKADAHKGRLGPDEILITSDTVVWHKGQSLEKAADASAAKEMLRSLSDDVHEVVTAICLTTPEFQIAEHATTRVWMRALTETEIAYYVAEAAPFDKAGAYGIQEWIGLIGVERIEGSYTNVVGLPTCLFHRLLTRVIE